jgi:hypothetical protein
MKGIIMFKKLGLLVVAAAPLSAFATVDVSAVTAAGTDIAAVGVAVFAVYVAIKLTKWIRRAL